MNDRSAGFTIIEVILFVAISAMLLVGAFVAMQSAITSTQFNDTTDSTQSYLQKIYFEVATGVNVRDDNLRCNSSGVIINDPTGTNPEPGASECAILGRLIQFNPGTGGDAMELTTRYLTSAMVYDLEDRSDIEAFAAGGYLVRTSTDDVPAMKETYELPWSALITHAKRRESITSQDIHSIAIVRSPVSERMMIYAFASTTPGSSQYADADNLLTGGRRAVLCLQSDTGLLSKKAGLTIWPGQSQDLIEIDRSGNEFSFACSPTGSVASAKTRLAS